MYSSIYCLMKRRDVTEYRGREGEGERERERGRERCGAAL